MKNKKINSRKSQKLWVEAKKIIPGGTQLLSKRAEMFLPDNWPAYYKKAKGVEVTDLDGKKYIDMSIMGVGSCILGYADKDVNSAVKKVIDDGSMCTLNSPEEVELAKLLLSIHPWAGMVRYARTGGEAVAVAVRIARASAGKQTVAFCGYHGWHDWYLSGNLASDQNLNGHLLPGLEPRGVPNELFNSAIPFQFNQIDQLKKIVKENSIGVIVMEVFRHQEPKNNFLQDVRKIADEIGAVLIFDEVSSGFRIRMGGIHAKYQVNPDVIVFGKAMSNGFPMAAIMGKKEIMDSAQGTFISSTYWTERVGPAAAIATIKKMKKEKVFAHIDKIGALVGKGWEKLAKKYGLDIKVIGPTAIITLEFNYPNAQAIKTLFTQEMLKRGFLASFSVYISFGHKEHHVKRYLRAVDEVFEIIKKSIDNNSVESLLEGPVAYSGFARLT